MRFGWLVGLGLLVATGCDAQSEACEDNCDKRATCIGDVDVDQCQAACGGERPETSEACVEADVAFQQCLVGLSCDDYIASRGCEAELSATAAACKP